MFLSQIVISPVEIPDLHSGYIFFSSPLGFSVLHHYTILDGSLIFRGFHSGKSANLMIIAVSDAEKEANPINVLKKI